MSRILLLLMQYKLGLMTPGSVAQIHLTTHGFFIDSKKDIINYGFLLAAKRNIINQKIVQSRRTRTPTHRKIQEKTKDTNFKSHTALQSLEIKNKGITLKGDIECKITNNMLCPIRNRYPQVYPQKS